MTNKDFEILSEIISKNINDNAVVGLVFTDFSEWLDKTEKSDLISEINKISENKREDYIKTLLLNCWISSAAKCLKNNE